MDALGSPMIDQAMKPPLKIIFGLAPKKGVWYITISAYFPTSKDPRISAAPCVIAGLMVVFAIYLLALRLSLSPVSSVNLPFIFFILSAVCHALITTSPILHIAWLSDEYMLNTPSSCNTSSAAIVSALILEDR